MDGLQNTGALLVPVNYMRNLLDFVELRGGSAANVLAAASVSDQIIDDSAAKISFFQFGQIILQALEECKEPALGLYLGNQLSVMTHGNLGHAVLSSDDAQQAVELAIRFFETRTPLATLHLIQQQGDVQITFEERYLLGAIRVPYLEAIVAALTAAITFFTSGQLRLRHAEFAFSAPPYSELYEAVLGCPVSFDACVTRVTFPASVLQTPSVLADRNVRNLALQQCEEEMEHIDKSLSLEKRIEQILLRFKGGFPSFDQVASELSVSSRTLRRRLLEKQTSFFTILDRVKYQSAKQYLETSSLSVQEIAYLLGYSDPSNFGRAFKKWNGVSPVEYKNNFR